MGLRVNAYDCQVALSARSLPAVDVGMTLIRVFFCRQIMFRQYMQLVRWWRFAKGRIPSTISKTLVAFKA